MKKLINLLIILLAAVFVVNPAWAQDKPTDDLFGRIANVTKNYAPNRKDFVYYPPRCGVHSRSLLPQVKNRNHTITAYAEIPADKASGLLVAVAGIYSGDTLYVKDNRAVHYFNAFSEDRYTITGAEVLPAGEVVIEVK